MHFHTYCLLRNVTKLLCFISVQKKQHKKNHQRDMNGRNRIGEWGQKDCVEIPDGYMRDSYGQAKICSFRQFLLSYACRIS